MDPQFAAVLLLITLAAAYLLHLSVRGWRRIRRGQCASSCGCPSKPQSNPPRFIEESDLTRRLRRKQTQ